MPIYEVLVRGRRARRSGQDEPQPRVPRFARRVEDPDRVPFRRFLARSHSAAEQAAEPLPDDEAVTRPR
jgi:hypothetical protein